MSQAAKYGSEIEEHQVTWLQTELERVRDYLNNTFMTAPEEAYIVNPQVWPGIGQNIE